MSRCCSVIHLLPLTGKVIIWQTVSVFSVRSKVSDSVSCSSSKLSSCSENFVPPFCWFKGLCMSLVTDSATHRTPRGWTQSSFLLWVPVKGNVSLLSFFLFFLLIFSFCNYISFSLLLFLIFFLLICLFFLFLLFFPVNFFMFVWGSPFFSFFPSLFVSFFLSLSPFLLLLFSKLYRHLTTFLITEK